MLREHPQLSPFLQVVLGASAGARAAYLELTHLTRIPTALTGFPAMLRLMRRGTAGPISRRLPAAVVPRRRKAWGVRLS